MKIKTKLKISTILTTLIAIAIGVILLSTIQQLEDISEQEILAGEILSGVFELNILTNDYLTYQSERSKVQWQLKYDSIAELLGDEEFGTGEKQIILKGIHKNHEDLKPIFLQLVAIHEKHDLDEEKIHGTEDFEQKLINQLFVLSLDMVSGASELFDINNEQLIDTEQNASLVVIILVVSMSIVVAANLFMVNKSVVNPVTKLREGIEIIGTGDLDYRVGIDSDDEIGDLSRSFDEMSGKLKSITTSRDELNTEIAERKNAEESLKVHAEKLKHSNELKDIFADVMRHDLLNPANIIKGYSEMLIDMEDDEKRIGILKKIEKSNEKLIDLIEMTARYAKLESIDELDFDKRDIAVIFKDVVENLREQIENRNIVFEFKAEGVYLANVSLIIEEAFVNLLSNAIKYSPKESKIIVDIIDMGENWKVRVTDFGEGVSDEDKTSLFDRFKRVGKGSVKGSGLGLAIVKRVIELHGGDVGVDDNPAGEGSVFWITIKKV